MANRQLNRDLLHAARTGDLEKVRNYLAEGANLNYEDWYDGTPLLAASEGGFINIVKLLLERADIDPNKENGYNGVTPLHAAASHGHLDIVQLLLERADIDPNKDTKYDGTPLHAASEGGFINIVKLLLERADIDPNKENGYNGVTPLHAAASHGHLDIVQLLLERADIDPNKETKYGNTPLHAAAKGGFINIVKLLLERADIDPKKENKYNGDTPLHSAASHGHLDIVQLLLERANIDPNKETKYGDTPLHAAADGGFINIVKLLLKNADIDPNNENKLNGNTPLHSAVSGGNLDIVELLLERADIDPNCENKYGHTPLHAAAEGGLVNIVKFLLERADIDPNKGNGTNGDTPLHIAVRGKNPSIVQLLLERGDIDPDKVNKINGDTPLHTAVRRQNISMVQLLLERRDIDPDKVNKENKTPIDVFEARDWNLKEDYETGKTIQELIKCHILEKELRGLGLETTDDLKDVMKLGSFKCFWNRVYIVGPYFSGKSCLAKLLVGDALPRERESTDGIWIYMGRAGMDINGEEWIVIPKGTAVQEILVSMMMSLSTCESLDTDNLTTRLQESDKNLHDSVVSRNSGHVEVLILKDSAQRKVHGERISKNLPMESCDAHDYKITPCISNENAHINDNENESKLQTVILSEIISSTAHGKNAFEEPTNAKQGIPLKRTCKTIVADTASHAHGVCVAAINTPRLCPVESRTSDVDELEHSPTEIPPKESSKSHVLPEEDSPTEVQSKQRASSDLNFAVIYSPGVDKAKYCASTEHIASTDVSVEGSIAVETDLEINKSKNSAAGVIMTGVSSLKQILQVSETSNDYFDVTTKQESRTSDVLLEHDSPSVHSEQRRSTGLNFAEMFLPDVDKVTYFASNEYIASTDVSVEDNIAVDTALETNKSANFAAGMKIPDVSSVEQRLQVSQTANDYFDLKTKQESSSAIYPKKDRSKSSNPVREKFKEKLMKEVANELSHNKLHEMVISSIREGKYKQKTIPIDIWDFGGQKDYYMTHQLFITSRGIFVLVFNGSRNLHKHMPDLSFLPGHFGKPTIAVYLLHWVNSILTYCKRSDDGFPRIVFVATHKDKIRKNVEKHKQKLMTVIEDIFESHAGLKHLEFKPLIFVNAMNETDPEIQALRQRLMDRAKEHPRWGEYMPTAWVPLELHLALQAEKGVNILTTEQIKMFNSQNESMVLTNKQLETFLKVQHSLGKLLYFDIANLRDFVIITPAYLVEVLRSIVTEKQFWPKGKQFQGIFQTMQKTGRLSRDDIDILWNQDIFRHILSYKDFIIEVLVHLDILVAERRVTEDLSILLHEVSKFIVPSMITKPNNTKYLKKFCKTGTSILLSYKFTEKVIPPAFPYRFIASFVDMWGVKNYKNKKRMLFSDLAVVEVDDKHDVAVQVIENRVVVSLIHADKKEHIVPTIATSVQECLTAAIHRISEFYSTLSADSFATNERSDIHMVMPFEIEFGVHCKKASCFFPHDKIPTAATWQCSEHKVHHDVRCLKLWFSEKMPREKCDTSCQGLGRLEVEQSPTNKHLRRLAASLEDKDCRELLIRLGLDTIVLNNLQEKFSPSAFHENDYKYTAMLRWKGIVTDSSFMTIADAFGEIDKHLLCEVIRDVNVDDVLTRFSITEDQANKTPTNTTLQELSNHIGNSGIQLAVELGLQSAEIEGIQNDHSCKLLHQNKEILRVWGQTKFPKPTIKELIKALQRIGKKDCLREISF